MLLDSLKLPKFLLPVLEEIGITAAKEIQIKTVSRIAGGNTVFAIGPEGCGKTTALVWSVLSKIKFAQEEAPRALIIVPDKESGNALLEKFQLYGKNTDLRFLGLFAGAALETHKDALLLGTDIVVGTPDRVEFVYARSGLNLNKLKIFAIDDADKVVQQGFHAVVHQITESLPKCQHVVFTSIVHRKVERMLELFMNPAVKVEINEHVSVEVETISKVLYAVPNYRSKQHLLLHHVQNYSKVAVFAQTALTAENLYQYLSSKLKGQISLLSGFDSKEVFVSSIEEFMSNENLRVLVVSNEDSKMENLQSVPTLLYFDVPLNREDFLNQIRTGNGEGIEREAIVYASDVELTQIQKIEQIMGATFPSAEMPNNLIVVNEKPINKETGNEDDLPIMGGAFHEKKESNAKEYNYKYKDRLKMFGKKNRKGKRG